MWNRNQVLSCLIGSTLFTLFTFFLCKNLWISKQKKRLLSPKYEISTIMQTGTEVRALNTSYLAELLDLSIDQPKSLYAVDVKAAKEKLLKSPLIRRAKVKRMLPATLYIDYEVRKPIAKLGDYENIAIDEEGYLFPMSPFLSSFENLPEIYLGLPAFEAKEDSFGRKGGRWNEPLQSSFFDLALDILALLKDEEIRLIKVDVSKAEEKSLGQREIVLQTEESLALQDGHITCTFPKTLRLSSKDYKQQLKNFLSLKKTMMEDYEKQLMAAELPQSRRFSSRIVDLRIAHLAFVEN